MTARAAIPSGADIIWRKWWIIGLAGALWMLLGLFLFANAFGRAVSIPSDYLAIALVLDAVLTLAAPVRQAGATRGTRFLKAGAFLLIAAVIVTSAGRAEMAVGILVGVFLIAEAAWRSAQAYRLPAAGRAIAYAVAEALLGIWSLLSYPAQGAIEADVSLLVMNSAFALCVGAARQRRPRLSP